jgi:tetratricopeptide (TPR) repeat protein
MRFNREIAARREPLKRLLDERARAGSESVTPDVFIAVARSLVSAAETRLDEAMRLDRLARETRARLEKTSDATARATLIKESQAARAALEDEAIAQLAEAYERGAVLAFYFADQLRGIETSGFDVANFFADMIASFDPARELARPAEYAAARERALSARKARLVEQAADKESSEEKGTDASRRVALVKHLGEVEKMLRARNYESAVERLRSLLQEFPGEPRILSALGQTMSLWARDTTDDNLQNERLNGALSYYRMAVAASSVETDLALLSRAHEAMGRILAFLDRTDEAMKEFEAAIKIGRVDGGAYDDALAGRNKLAQQPKDEG